MRYAIIGNSGSGKSTLARRLASAIGVDPIDLDAVYWEPERPGVRRDPVEAEADLLGRLEGHRCWIVEGCYEELVEPLLKWQPMLLWLEPGEATCIQHCRQRPWEPHKYASREAQDQNLAMLLQWVADYYHREGPMSYSAHEWLFTHYIGSKKRLQDASRSLDELGLDGSPGCAGV
jgi:adenylate kinase family enzyme